MTDNYFNTDIIRNHDHLMTLNGWMVEHWNFCMTFEWNSDEVNDELHDLKQSYLCYDV